MRRPFTLTSFLMIVAAVFAVSAAAQTPTYWRDTARPTAAGADAPDTFRSVELDWPALRAHLDAPDAGANELSLPAPEGGYVRFALSDSGTLPPELAARYRSIRSLIGTAADGTRARIDVSPIGLNAMVFARDGIWLVRPETYGPGAAYRSFRRSALAADPAAFRCAQDHDDATAAVVIDTPAGTPPVSTGTVRRTYRTAVAANFPYVAAIAGTAPPTVEIGLAAVTVAMNRVNEIYERDFSIHFTLVPDNDRIIYADAASDPYTNGNDALDENTPHLNEVIGTAHYDLGHVFTTRSGVALRGSICTGSKGAGTTGLNAARLQSDAFYVDYVAHEIGHQLGGRHTFNSTVSNCGGTNRSALAAYEPGSGSTIMAYAGICGSANLQPHSDPYFHARSLEEIAERTTAAGCGAEEAQPAAAPTILAPPQRAIPARTPYALTGSALSPAADASLSYAWEQYDLGPANNALTTDPGTGPIQRSFLPSARPTRYVPRLDTLLGGTPAIGEILPATTRALNYRLTARDNLRYGTSAYAATRLDVIDTGEAFAVTLPAAGATWRFGVDVEQTVTWAVAATDAPPIACARVDLDVVAAAGERLAELATLGRGLPNSGTARVAVPNVERAAAHVRVRCADNVFFAVSPAIAFVGEDILFSDGFED